MLYFIFHIQAISYGICLPLSDFLTLYSNLSIHVAADGIVSSFFIAALYRRVCVCVCVCVCVFTYHTFIHSAIGGLAVLLL